MNGLEQESPVVPPAAAPPVPLLRSLVWSLRRELWENHSLVLGPLLVALLLLAGFLVALVKMPTAALSHGHTGEDSWVPLLVVPIVVTPPLLFGVMVLLALFYCVESLHAERRDRSILFWKSMPVSDLTTVVSKALVPLAFLPLYTFVLAVVMELLMLLLVSLRFLAQGEALAAVLAQVPMLRLPAVLLYGELVFTLAAAPLFAWLILVSGWARRAPMSWAVLPPVLIGIVERVALGTTAFRDLLTGHFVGIFRHAFVVGGFGHGDGPVKLPQVNALGFISQPTLWVGLLLAALMLAVAVWQRRYRQPL